MLRSKLFKIEKLVKSKLIQKKIRNSNLKSFIKNILRFIFKITGFYIPSVWLKYKLINYFQVIPPKKIQFFSQFMKKGDLCYDIGAWEGEYTKIFLTLGARIISVEPQDKCIKVLGIKYGKNKNVKIVGKAVGEKNMKGSLAVCEQPGQSQKATLSKRFMTETRHAELCNWTNFQPVSIITLDKLFEKYGIPNFCKIDVEGFEESVLRGLNYPISFISFEFHKELLDSVENCCRKLSKLGNFRYNCTIDPLNQKFAFFDWVTDKELLYELNSREDKLLRGDIYAKLVKA
jgi:FkbM family methyltransferase